MKKSLLKNKKEYLLGLIRYIHLNPIRAKFVKNLQEYRWSSHNAYLKGIKRIVETDKVLRMFSERPSQARTLYQDFVNQGIGAGGDDSIYKAVGQQILGDDRFIEKIEQRIDNLEKPLKRPSLGRIFSKVQAATGIAQERITSRSRGEDVKLARNIMVGVCREVGYRLVDLQSEIKRDLSVLSQWSKASETEAGQKVVKRILRALNA